MGAARQGEEHARDLPSALVEAGKTVPVVLSLTPGVTVEEAESRLIQLTLEHTRDNKTRAAEILGISLKTLHNKLKEYETQSQS